MNTKPFGQLLLAGLLLMVYGMVSAQVPAPARVVYPVKQNNLWGFMSKSGKLLVDPSYDAVGRELTFLVEHDPVKARDYRLVELNGKLGVINRNLERVLPCNNDFILPISPDQYLVRQPEGYTILDEQGRNLPDRYYSKLEFAGITADSTYYYTIYDGNQKGLINAQGDTLLPCAYQEIKTLDWAAAPFLTQVRSDRGWWRLTAPGGKTILRDLSDVKSPHPNLLLVATKTQRLNRYLACNLQGQPLPMLNERPTVSGEYLSPELVNLEQFDAENERYVQVLFQVRERRAILPQLQEFRPLDGRYAIATEIRALAGMRGTAELETLLTPRGTLVDSNRWYVKIESWPNVPDHYRVRAPGGWGILNGNGQLIVPTEYTQIGDLDDGLALIVRNGRSGMITVDGRVVATTDYTAIHRRDNALMLQKGDNSTMLYLDDSLQMVSLREYRNLRTLTVTQPKTIRIAKHQDFESLRNAKLREAERAGRRNGGGGNFRRVSPPAQTNQNQSTKPDRSRLTPWFSSTVTLEGKRLHPTSAAQALGMDTTFLDNHNHPYLSLGPYTRFDAEDSILPAPYFQQLVGGNVKVRIRPQRLFLDAEGKLLSEKYLGFRIFDYQKGWRCAPALLPSGRFQLLDEKGELLRSAGDTITEFTFVGKPKNGLLRVCVGGRLVNTEEDQIPAHPLTSLNGMLEDFSVRVARGTLDESHRTMIARSLPGDTARWGVVDSLGRWIVPPVYDYLHDNINRQIIAFQGGEYGVIGTQGDTIVPFRYKRIINYKGFWRVNSAKIGEVYFNWRGHQILDVGVDSVGLFRENYAPYRQDDRWAYVDQSGTPLPGGGYLSARSFGEGLAAVLLDSTEWAFIDTSGQVQARLPAAAFQDFSHFSAGRCRFRRGGQFGYLDRDFQEVPLPTLLRKASDFDRGRAIIELGAGVAVIDTSGKFLVEPGTYQRLTAWNEAGLAVATLPSNKKCLVDLQGVRVNETTFDDIILQGEALYPARTDRRWGYIDRKGQAVIAPKFTTARPFSEGFARVRNQRSGDRWLFIHRDGRPINGKTYVRAEDFSGGQASVRTPNGTSRLLLPSGKEKVLPGCTNLFVDGTFIGCNHNSPGAFFADRDGNPLFLSTYDKIQPFGNGEMTFVRNHGRWGIIDRRGMQLVDCKYYMYAGRPDGIFKVGPPAFGIYDREGTLIVPPVYDNLVLMEKGLFRVERGGKVGYLSTEGEMVWALRN